MRNPVEGRIVLYLTDDERYAADEIAQVPQIAHDDVQSALHNLDRLEPVCSHTRLVGNRGIEFWQIFWHRAERPEYCS